VLRAARAGVESRARSIEQALREKGVALDRTNGEQSAKYSQPFFRNRPVFPHRFSSRFPPFSPLFRRVRQSGKALTTHTKHNDNGRTAPI